MEQFECALCGKVIEGYSVKHVEYLMSQHDLSKHNETKGVRDGREA